MILGLLLQHPYVRLTLGVILDFWAACTIFSAAMRAVPEERFVAFERAYPRAGQLARAVRKFGTDFIPFVQSIVAAFQGLPVERASRALVNVLILGATVASLTSVPALVLGCGPVRRAALSSAPNVPPVETCQDGTYRCQDEQPQVCHRGDGDDEGRGRWWAILPRHASGAPRRCPSGCALNPEGRAVCLTVTQATERDGGVE